MTYTGPPSARPELLRGQSSGYERHQGSRLRKGKRAGYLDELWNFFKQSLWRYRHGSLESVLDGCSMLRSSRLAMTGAS